MGMSFVEGVGVDSDLILYFTQSRTTTHDELHDYLRVRLSASVFELLASAFPQNHTSEAPKVRWRAWIIYATY